MQTVGNLGEGACRIAVLGDEAESHAQLVGAMSRFTPQVVSDLLSGRARRGDVLVASVGVASLRD